ncbi:MAG: 50S ribosomal protein L3 [Spirochaetes bacterium RBG_13_51_14]|nr:MAG: 50S ribosomal protein L3 [Spirochaetes bacterium RBG_13_51_14]
MKKALIGRKIGMTQFIHEDGTVIPVTVCELGPCVVVQKKSRERDGYAALKLGYVDVKEQRLSKALMSDLKKKGIKPLRIFREVGVFDDTLDTGSVVTCSIFAENDFVNVSGISKGKGFAGVVRRYGFGGGRETHGSTFHRAPGSIGACAFPSEVWRGQRMPGRLGNKTVTVKNLKIVKILEDKNIVLISGAVPGRRNTLITVCEG